MVGGVADNWRTPPWLLELLFPDGLYFDPNPANPEGLRGFDGLGDWPTDRPVFLNPPYSEPGPWLRKAAHHPGPVVCLVKLDPSTEWWQRYAPFFRVVAVGQRLRFLSDSEKDGVANFPSAFWMKGLPGCPPA